MSEPTSESSPRTVRDEQIVDLSSLSSADELSHIAAFRDVQVVIVPESLAAAVERIPREGVQMVLPIPDGLRVRAHTGLVQLGGETLSQPGSERDFLVVVGALLFTSPVIEPTVAGVAVVGAALAPTGSETGLGSVLSRVEGAVQYFPYTEGQRISVLSGQLSLPGSALEQQDADVLLFSGQITVTSAVASVGPQLVVVLGQAMLPRDSQEVLSGRLQVFGQTLWYDGTAPRVFTGNTRLGRQFLELLPEPAPLVSIGRLHFELDVTVELLTEKVVGLAAVGVVIAPRAVLPAVQVLARDIVGRIEAAEDQTDEQADDQAEDGEGGTR